MLHNYMEESKIAAFWNKKVLAFGEKKDYWR